MDCLNPMLAVKVGDQYKFIGAVKGSSTESRKYLYDSSGKFVILPCGQCYACRIAKSREWASRCVMESKLHKENCFITLTYNDEHLPSDMSLQKDDFTKFIKRLRKNTGEKIRYYACGEYGDLYQRPHFHACLFGYRPDDLVLFSVRSGVNLYTSSTLEKAWQYRGFVTVGDVTYYSAAYGARYVLKKTTSNTGASTHNCILRNTTIIVRISQITSNFF